MRVYIWKKVAGERDVLVLPGPRAGMRPVVLRDLSKESLVPAIETAVEEVRRGRSVPPVTP